MQEKLTARAVTGTMLSFLECGYHAFSVVSLWCAQHGLIRMNLPLDETPTGEYHVCPICQQLCPCGTLPAVGITRGPLPAFDIIIPPIGEVFLESFDEAPAPDNSLERRRCSQCGVLYQPTHGNSKLCGDSCAQIRASNRAAKRYASKTAAATA